MAGFDEQPPDVYWGTGPFFRMTALHYRLCTPVHDAQCALSCKKMASGDGHAISVNRP